MCSMPDFRFISIHTPVKGVTYRTIYNFVLTSNFNPHSREGSDNKEVITMTEALTISIHTPVKGVTELR